MYSSLPLNCKWWTVIPDQRLREQKRTLWLKERLIMLNSWLSYRDISLMEEESEAKPLGTEGLDFTCWLACWRAKACGQVSEQLRSLTRVFLEVLYCLWPYLWSYFWTSTLRALRCREMYKCQQRAGGRDWVLLQELLIMLIRFAC